MGLLILMLLGALVMFCGFKEVARGGGVLLLFLLYVGLWVWGFYTIYTHSGL